MMFSIIVPVFKTERYLRKCLDSIFGQTFSDYEVIIVDDGSPDGCGTICDEYEERYNNVIVIHQFNQGLSSARNRGLQLARGKWVWFVDSDDYIEPFSLERLNYYIEKYTADVFSFNSYRVDINDKVVSKLLTNYEHAFYSFGDDNGVITHIVNNVARYSEGWEAWSRIYRLDVIRCNNIEFSDTDRVFAEDLDFYLKYLLHTKSVINLCDILYDYRINPDSILSKNDENSILPRLYFLAEDVFFYAKLKKKKSYIKRFGEIYRAIIDFHKEFNQSSLSVEECEMVDLKLRRYKYHRKWYH